MNRKITGACFALAIIIALAIIAGLAGCKVPDTSSAATSSSAPPAVSVAPQTQAPPPPPAPTTPALSIGQRNALDKAKAYIDYSGFSRQGLIEQLKYEGFSEEDATFGVDTLAPDWLAEAAEKAHDYMDYSSFSKRGLIDQLQYEGFTLEQANYGAMSVGF